MEAGFGACSKREAVPPPASRLPPSLHRQLVDVAPLPIFPRLETRDDRVLRPVKVGGRVLADRVVATTDVRAGVAESEVDPAHSGFQALLASLWGSRSDVPDL
jgi:hypothetical protein